MKTGLLLVTLGGPRSPEEIPAFIRRFIGRELPPPAMKAIIERYRQIGGFSPLVRITQEQAEALGEALGDRYLSLAAFRHSPPFIEETLARMAASGVAQILFLSLSPFYATVTTGDYIGIARAFIEKRSLPLPVGFIHSWCSEPLFIESWVAAIRTQSFDEGDFFLFSAHSLPVRYATEPYRRQIEETVAAVAATAGIGNHALGWQSIPGNAAEPWITPTVEERIDDAASAGFKGIIQLPIGFTADHIETLYDIDITHRQYALSKGLSFRRVPSLNAGETFIRALKKVVTNHLAEGGCNEGSTPPTPPPPVEGEG